MDKHFSFLYELAINLEQTMYGKINMTPLLGFDMPYCLSRVLLLVFGPIQMQYECSYPKSNLETLAHHFVILLTKILRKKMHNHTCVLVPLANGECLICPDISKKCGDSKPH